jgi:hypothetical protein
LSTDCWRAPTRDIDRPRRLPVRIVDLELCSRGGDENDQ